MRSDLINVNPVSLELTGVTLTRHWMEIANEDGFRRAGYALAAMDSCSQWWWADYLLFAEKFNLKTVLDSALPDLHRSTIYSYVQVGRYFSPKDRNLGLTFGHHAAVMYILGDESSIGKAKDWLEKAARNEWSIGELREAMRLARRRAEGDPGPMRGVLRITDFVKISRFCATVKAEDFPPLELDEIRRSTQPLYDFLCEIHRPKFSSV